MGKNGMALGRSGPFFLTNEYIFCRAPLVTSYQFLIVIRHRIKQSIAPAIESNEAIMKLRQAN